MTRPESWFGRLNDEDDLLLSSELAISAIHSEEKSHLNPVTMGTFLDLVCTFGVEGDVVDVDRDRTGSMGREDVVDRLGSRTINCVWVSLLVGRWQTSYPYKVQTTHPGDKLDRCCTVAFVAAMRFK